MNSNVQDKPKCCGIESVWVENVVDKGYHYCRQCKNEVVEIDSYVSFTSEKIDALKYLYSDKWTSAEEFYKHDKPIVLDDSGPSPWPRLSHF